MKFDKIKNKGQARLFESQYLEVLTKTHPLFIWGMYLPVFGYMLYYSYNTLGYGIGKVALIFLGGIFTWSLFEYAIHRYLFHYVTENPKWRRIVYVLHGNHHEYPRDKQRLFMPPVPSLIIASIIFAVMYFLMGEMVYMFFPGFLIGYLMYGSMHYAIHAWHPPFKFLKPLWRNHHLHHYKSDDKGFGVSSSFWDRVFGTYFDVNEKEDKEKAKALMFDK